MIEQEISFILECEKLKGVLRRCSPVGLSRKENSGEHSWSVVLAALVLAPKLVPDLCLNRIVRMLAIHDVVEIDAGDTFCYADQTGKFEKEDEAARRIFGLLPAGVSEEFYELWLEFEKAETGESRFANAIDRILPMSQNFHNGGGGWTEHGICFEQVYERNRTMAGGSEELWKYAEGLILKANEAGLLPKRAELERLVLWAQGA